MNKEQIQSIIRSGLKIAGSALAAHGLTKYSAIINSEDAIGFVMALVGLYLSHSNHADSTPAKTP
jgi:hypothetical protein